VQTLLDSTYEKFANENWDEVISISTKVLDLQPFNVVALVNRAGALAEKGRLRESLQDSNAAIKIDPNYAIAYHNKGYVYELMEKYTNSIIEYKTSCSFGINASCKEVERITSLEQKHNPPN